MKREARKDWTLTDTAGSNCCIRTALPLAVVEVACLHIPAAAPLPNDPATFADDEGKFGTCEHNQSSQSTSPKGRIWNCHDMG